MNTIFENGNNPDAISKASAILKADGLVAFPTETVYGLGADALHADAAAKIYAAKGRPSDNPLIVHIADTEAVYRLAKAVPEKAAALMEAFWPGPLTLVLPKNSIVPDGTTGGLDTVAIRMPSHPVALQLIRESGVYIAAPSANTSGRPSPTTAKHVLDDMNGRIDMILDGGAVGIGIESTIVDLTGDIPTILRPGFITKKMLEDIVGEVAIDPAITAPSPDLRPKAPGMKYTHYAPKGELSIVESKAGDAASVAKKIDSLVSDREREGYKAVILISEENKELYSSKNIITLGSKKRDETIAATLYAALRKCDELGADYIFSEAFSEGALSGAIMNRLLKAAGQRVIEI